MPKKFLLALMSFVIASLGMLPASAGAQVFSGVPSKFALCLDGGYRTLARANGTSFANPGACVSYAVHGGTLFRSIDASSVYTPLRGFGGPVGAPDANGDRIGSTGDGGLITGAFSVPSTCVPVFPNTECGNFEMLFLGYVVHATGIAEGNGTASCDPCSVGGLTGTVRFSTTAVGHSVVIGDLVFGVLDSGTWTITGATGNLAAISGSGTWTQEADRSRIFRGSLRSPV